MGVQVSEIERHSDVLLAIVIMSLFSLLLNIATIISTVYLFYCSKTTWVQRGNSLGTMGTKSDEEIDPKNKEERDKRI